MLRVVAGLALLVSLVLNLGIVDLLTAIDPSPEWEPVRMLEAGWGAGALEWGVVVLLAVARATRRPAPGALRRSSDR